jgi:prepilin-type N-terminal cleavage/methylation domain-containing protein
VPLRRGLAARKGFSLIEVLIAATILGVGLTMLLTAASRCLAVMKISRNYQKAQWALNLGLLEHPLIETDDVSDWEVSAVDYDGFTFSREVEEEDVETEDGLFIVRSRVVWSDRGSETKEEVEQYVLNLDAIEE